ncbi:MAG: hypothetical protein GF370_01565 [Candidatus Nealsonbacteria bacterium]|nr:hypothetical protein [Candidatus Nealsonbacteria bacterium]
MNNNQLINTIRELKSVKPRKEWVMMTKDKILTEKARAELFPFFKPVYAGLFCLLFIIGIFDFSQEALPGESLYYLKKVSERGEVLLASIEEKPKVRLELANRRLEELNQIAEKNEVRKLASAIGEFQANVSEVAKDISRMEKIDQEFVDQAKKLEQNKQKAEETLATKIETEELDGALASVVEREISDLEERSLTEKEKEILEEAKQDFAEENYSEALMKIWKLSQE